MTIAIQQLDHLVLTVVDIDATVDFYVRVLGMKKVVFGDPPRTALAFGAQKINLHPAAAPFEPRAECATPGSADLCFIADTPLDTVIATLHDAGVDITEGPVDRSGATGGLRSVYIRDPDANLIEISNRQETMA